MGWPRPAAIRGPWPLRSTLIGEMQSHEVRSPQKLLESDTNSLVVVRGYFPPGVQKGDRFDVEVVVPPKSKTTSLRGGYLLRCRMREMRVSGRCHSFRPRVRSGTGIGGGGFPVRRHGRRRGMKTRGRVLGGGQSQVSRPLGLAIRGESTVRQSAMIGAVINARFHKIGSEWTEWSRDSQAGQLHRVGGPSPVPAQYCPLHPRDSQYCDAGNGG